jgi:SAM-dependent methyltransferase
VSSFKISDTSFDYLVAQVGELDTLKSVRHVWERAYERNTIERINNILPYIPDEVSTILDIGSGLGGIDVLLYRWFDSKPQITLLDGSTYGSMVLKHAEPFNSAAAALGFQNDNGVKNVRFMEHDNLKPAKFDLIVSFRAWCFHIAPVAYLEYVKASCHPGTVLIVDVRKEAGARFWRDQIRKAFNHVATIEEGKKHERWKLLPKS